MYDQPLLQSTTPCSPSPSPLLRQKKIGFLIQKLNCWFSHNRYSKVLKVSRWLQDGSKMAPRWLHAVERVLLWLQQSELYVRDLKGRCGAGELVRCLSLNRQIMSWQEQPSGEFLITMSNKENEVVKFIGEEQRIKCEKIITLHLDNDRPLIAHYEAQLGRVRDYLQRLHGFSSHLPTWHALALYRRQTEDRLVLKIVTRFWEYPTFEDFLRAEAIRPGEQMERSAPVLLHFLEQFLQVLLRAGGIDNFFYTPRNLFIIAPLPGQRLQPPAKLLLNFTSLAGLKLLVGSKRIIREDFCEIFPLLPPNFLQLRQRQEWMRLERTLRKRALGWLAICFIARKVPELLDPRTLQSLVPEKDIIKSLKNSPEIFEKVLRVFKKNFETAEGKTGIKFTELFTLIFVAPYQKELDDQDFPFVSWEEIYSRLFEQNHFARQEREEIAASRELLEASKFFQKMLLAIWKAQPLKEYYLERDFAVDARGNRPQSMIYLLAKLNCNFHKLLRYRDVCQLVLHEQFSEDATQLVSKLMRLFNEAEQGGQPPEKGENGQQQESKAGRDRDSDRESEDAQLYNPFLPKTPEQLNQISREISCEAASEEGFVNKLKRAPELLRPVSSLEYFESESGKRIVSVSQKQSILSEFCSSLWPL